MTGQTTPATGCCQVRRVSGKGAEIDGLYVLGRTEEDKPQPQCVDGCVYVRQEDSYEYCFQEVDLAEGADVACEAPTSSVTGTPMTSSPTPSIIASSASQSVMTSTPTPSIMTSSPTPSIIASSASQSIMTSSPTPSIMTSTSTPSIMTSSGTPDVMTSTPIPTTTVLPPLPVLNVNASDLIAKKETHEKALTEATAKHVEATNLSNELKNAEAKIDQLVGSRKRIIREEFSNSTAPAATCAEIIEFIQKISDAVKQKNVSAATNYAKRITASTATCSEEEKNNLTTKKSLVTEAKNTTESIISEIAVTITETKHKINDVINQMKVVNNYLGTLILNYESTFQLKNCF